MSAAALKARTPRQQIASPRLGIVLRRWSHDPTRGRFGRPFLAANHHAGLLGDVADELNRQGYRTRRGSPWWREYVKRLIAQW
ncbi:MAG: hypothetical protein ABIZ80_14375 [Bryobacteraceae bacterium]